MKSFALTTALATTALALAACNADTETANTAGVEDNALTDTSADSAGGSTTTTNTTTTTTNWKGARIVEENGTTYRVNADGTRVALGANDSRIVVENNVRYRVDPDGARVRIGDDGIQVDGPDVDLPDVDVGVNAKGNLDVDVGDKDPDGGR